MSVYVIGVHEGGEPLRLVASDLPFTYVSRSEDALHFSTAAAATSWALARGLTLAAAAYLRNGEDTKPPTPGPSYYSIAVTRTPEKALTG